MRKLKNLDQDTKELLLLIVLPICLTAALAFLFPTAFSIY